MARLRLPKHFRRRGGTHAGHFVLQTLESATLFLVALDLLAQYLGSGVQLLVTFQLSIGTLYDELLEVGPIAVDLLPLLLNLPRERGSEAFLFELFTDALRNLENSPRFARARLTETLCAAFPQLREVQGAIS